MKKFKPWHDEKLMLENASLTLKELANKFGGSHESYRLARMKFGITKEKMFDTDFDSSKNIDTEFEEHNENAGTINIQRKLYFEIDEPKTPENILVKLGYDPDKWSVSKWRFGTWEVAMKGKDEPVECTTIRIELKEKKEPITAKEAMNIANEVFANNITKSSLPIKRVFDVSDVMMEIPPIELHLGKLAWHEDTGEDYDKDIAAKIFRQIFDRVILEQEIHKCDTALMLIGSDFFNSDTAENTTTKGTQQQNDMRFQKMFKLGLELYKNAIDRMSEKFRVINLKLVPGNHDYMMSFYLFVALSEHYSNNPNIIFDSNHKDTQAFEFGKVGLFFNHGDVNLKRLQGSIAAEFYDVWGRTIYRELHLGHLHKEVVTDDNNGLITRRVGSPTGTDAWHYQSRYLGAVKKHQAFIWHKDHGLLNVIYIPFGKSVYTDKIV